MSPQPVPLPQPVTGLIECGWSPTLTVSVPTWWPSGVYLTKLTRQAERENNEVLPTE